MRIRIRGYHVSFFTATFDSIVSDVKDSLPPGASRNGKSLTPNERVMIFVIYLTTNSFLWFKTYAHGISKTTIWNCIHECISGFMENFVPDNILLPNREQALREAELFSEMSGFPRVVWGSIDGSHMALRPPKEAREDYRNR